MSEDAAAAPSSPSSPTPSVSLVEAKADTRLVLKAFLRHSLSIPADERPGRVGGAYKDHAKYSASLKDPKRQLKEDILNSQDESSPDEKKGGFKDFIKRLQPRSAALRQQEGELVSPSSTSEEEGSDGKQQKKKKKKKLKTQLSFLFRRKDKEEREKEKEREREREREREKERQREKEREKENVQRPQRPSTLTIRKEAEPVPVITSPTHPPEFYEGVAVTLDRIAQRSKSFKRPCTDRSPTPHKLSPARDKDEVVKQLVQVLSTEADTINSKIQLDPFLRSTLTRLSYASFAKLLDTFASQAEAPPPPDTFAGRAEAPPPAAAASPTLRRVAITMEVSRRVVTATGEQRMQGYAERYMENFSPWVKSQGGWESIVQLEEVFEYD